jgi:hypothetical protein
MEPTTIELRTHYSPGRQTIFSHTCEDNTIKTTVEEALLSGVSLEGVYLNGANFSRWRPPEGARFLAANLGGADLSGSVLIGINFNRASLCSANFHGACIRDSYMFGADLGGASFAYAEIKNTTVLSEHPVTKTPIFLYGLRWEVIIDDTHMKIGCQNHSHSAWAQFDDETIHAMDEYSALAFWKSNRDALLALCRDHNPEEKETKNENKAS